MVGSPQIDPNSDPTTVINRFIDKAYDEMMSYLSKNPFTPIKFHLIPIEIWDSISFFFNLKAPIMMVLQ